VDIWKNRGSLVGKPALIQKPTSLDELLTRTTALADISAIQGKTEVVARARTAARDRSPATIADAGCKWPPANWPTVRNLGIEAYDAIGIA
jgi:hypothetical protein